ncbi:MAG: hypothetical protein HKO93_02625 [Flavobacteriales bacterium]|nr:hypothetical protein [Flavobacteriales bacterium]
MRSSGIIYFLLFLLLSCSSEEGNEHLLDRMCGEWEFTGTEIREEWKKTDHRNYHIDVISYAGREPELVQTIDITEKEGELYYDGEILRDHNTTRPIHFKAIETSTDRILFENAAQEFPQNIQYTLVNENKIRVKISGSQNSRYREQEFVYYRVGSEHSSSQ